MSPCAARSSSIRRRRSPTLPFTSADRRRRATTSRPATVDVYLTWGEPPDAVAQKIADVRQRAAARGRVVRFGLRVHVIVRETESAAWQAAGVADCSPGRRVDCLCPEGLRALRVGGPAAHGRAARRPARRPGGEPEPLGRRRSGRGGAGTALVGDPETVATRLREYAALGIDTFILSGYPHLEEAYRVAELLLPRLPLSHPRRPVEHNLTGPFGEMLAQRYTPAAARAGGVTPNGTQDPEASTRPRPRAPDA